MSFPSESLNGIVTRVYIKLMSRINGKILHRYDSYRQLLYQFSCGYAIMPMDCEIEDPVFFFTNDIIPFSDLQASVTTLLAKVFPLTVSFGVILANISSTC